MKSTMSDEAILEEIGARLRRERLNRDLTQGELAERAGLARSTVAKAESGGVTTVATLVAMLRAMQLLSRLDQFLPEPPLSPVQLAKLMGRRRQRASGDRKKKQPSDSWEWGE
ncbi:MAG: helix-turn-helix transcriptional regulator [Candidatus Eisenbacteria bacterium]|uniref:Helix-turn-helix transcriptional regulator n=1 Tax=Eiseniibacteriota bacterium TaxID=2212470 RepID=A0A7Y2ECA8_UNCEI|nr:helix-turn-helix transcriptional regulator [Candidatus Eisenbacteria bacterium]